MSWTYSLQPPEFLAGAASDPLPVPAGAAQSVVTDIRPTLFVVIEGKRSLNAHGMPSTIDTEPATATVADYRSLGLKSCG